MAGAGEGAAVCGYWWEGSKCQRCGEGALGASERGLASFEKMTITNPPTLTSEAQRA